MLRFAEQCRAVSPDPASLLSMIEHRGSRLWSMPVAGASVRVGLVADDDAWQDP